MRAQLGAEQIDQSGVHELVVVGDAQGEEGLIAELGGEALVHPAAWDFSMQKIRSAQPMWPAVTLMRAPFSVPAERAS